MRQPTTRGLRRNSATGRRNGPGAGTDADPALRSAATTGRIHANVTPVREEVLATATTGGASDPKTAAAMIPGSRVRPCHLL